MPGPRAWNGLRRLLCAALLGAGGCAAWSATPAAAGDGPPEAGVRRLLPAAVTPDHYRIDVVPDAASLSFRGTVAIDVTVHRATNEIVLNCADIVIDRASLTGFARAPAIRYDADRQTAAFALPRRLEPGRRTLRLDYHGRIYRQASGLFALDYATPQGMARALFTQFELSDARRFVPSWDEPARKATFELTATVPAGQMAVSNMPVQSTQTLAGGLQRVHFARTPRMSSYLLYFGSGDFERVSRKVGSVDVGVVVKRGSAAGAGFALDVAAEILPYYDRYFGTAYPLPKLDLIAAPGSSQFFSAMENWGAILYFERALLIDSKLSTERDRQRVYTVIAHEMAHQWFGDLVTMEWWDDLWLNEGFASWMDDKVTDHFHPEWNIWLQAARGEQSAMQQDSRDGTHPVITPVADPQDAGASFDAITYSKGAAVIRMLEAYLGEEPFRAGVRRYMRDHAYGNSVTDDLWREMDAGSRHPIARIAHEFTLQPGVPLVTEDAARCAGGGTDIAVSQGQFASAEPRPPRIWHVPVTFATVGRAPVSAVVAGGGGHVRADGCGTLVINAGQTAYFRSLYSSAGRAAVAAGYAALPASDQLGILDDTTALAEAGFEPMSALLDLTTKFPADADPLVAAALVGVLQDLDQLYGDLPARSSFRGYARAALAPYLERTGWNKLPGEADNVALLRSELLVALGDFGDAAVLAGARSRFADYLVAPAAVDAGTRHSVLRITAASADPATWDRLHALARAATTEIERRELYELLASAEDEALARRALELALSGEPPATLMPEMIRAVSLRHPALALDFAIRHWDAIGPQIEPTRRASFVPRLLSTAADVRLLGPLSGFADAHIAPGARMDLRKIESSVRYRAQVRGTRLAEVDAWIRRTGS